MSEKVLMEQTMRWFGPSDPVSLSYLRQAGCTGVVTALHHIQAGEIWPVNEIEERKKMIEASGLTWKVVESLPVHEDIKKQTGNTSLYIENYKISLRNLGACGIKVITYNFMPVLDWMRTDPSYLLSDGSKALRFEKDAFVAFDLFLLERPGAHNDYSHEEIKRAEKFLSTKTDEEKGILYNNVLMGLPGGNESFTKEKLLSLLASYHHVTAEVLKQNLFSFLKQVVPVAEEAELKMAIHPDDPPFPVLGLPRVVSTEQDIRELRSAVPSLANGLCFCTGSFGVRADNDLPGMIRKFGDYIHFLHLRNTKSDSLNNFYEADHLDGDTNMVDVVKEIVLLMKRTGHSIPMRPDHGHQMLDDLNKKTNPGYTAIGRLKGLAEIRGLELGLASML